MYKNNKLNAHTAHEIVSQLYRILTALDLSNPRIYEWARARVILDTWRVHNLVPNKFPNHLNWQYILEQCRLQESVVPAGDSEEVSMIWSALVDVWVELGPDPEMED